MFSLKKPRRTSCFADNIDLNFVGNLKSHISKTNFSPTNIALGNYNVKQTSTGSNAGFFCTLIEDIPTKFKKSLVVHNWLNCTLIDLKLYKPHKFESIFNEVIVLKRSNIKIRWICKHPDNNVHDFNIKYKRLFSKYFVKHCQKYIFNWWI